MDEADGFDLDRSTARAWTVFLDRLSVVVSGLESGASLRLGSRVAASTQDAGPFVEYSRKGEWLRIRLSLGSSLSAGSRLPTAQVAELRTLGFRRTEGGPQLTLTVGDADQLALMGVRVLRDVYGVPHPALLEVSDRAEELGVQPPVEERPPAAPATVFTPKSRDELQASVDEVIAGIVGSEPMKDGDGDIPLPMGSSVVFVRVPTGFPTVELYCPLVTEVSDLVAARREVGILNRNTRMIKFQLLGNTLTASLFILGLPFVPDHLRQALMIMGRTSDTIDEDLAERTGGRVWFDHSETTEQADEEDSEVVEGELHPALRTLLELDLHGTGLAADVVASACEFDSSLILSLLNDVEEQEIEWQQSVEDAMADDDTELADVNRNELRAWGVTAASLRGALLYLYQRPGEPEGVTRDVEDSVRFSVAGDASAPAEVLARLAADPNDSVRRQVAENPAAPPEVLEALASDPASDVRRMVAGNEATRPEVLATLAADPDDGVRKDTATNTATPPSVLQHLATDRDQGVRREVAGNTSTPPGPAGTTRRGQ